MPTRDRGGPIPRQRDVFDSLELDVFRGLEVSRLTKHCHFAPPPLKSFVKKERRKVSKRQILYLDGETNGCFIFFVQFRRRGLRTKEQTSQGRSKQPVFFLKAYLEIVFIGTNRDYVTQ